jgi:hypothetical protein
MTTINEIINACRFQVATIDYNTVVYGRAMVFQEKQGDGLVSIPKVLIGDNEYQNPLPDDNDGVIAFFQAVGPERYGEYATDEIGDITRQIAFTWWGDLTNTNGRTLEQIKWEHIERLQRVEYVRSIDSYVDERYQNVFPDFQHYLRNIEQKTNWLMAPNSGFRLVFTVSYGQSGGLCV